MLRVASERIAAPCILCPPRIAIFSEGCSHEQGYLGSPRDFHVDTRSISCAALTLGLSMTAALSGSGAGAICCWDRILSKEVKVKEAGRQEYLLSELFLKSGTEEEPGIINVIAQSGMKGGHFSYCFVFSLGN